MIRKLVAVLICLGIGTAVFLAIAAKNDASQSVATDVTGWPVFLPVAMQDGRKLHIADSEVTWHQWQHCVDAHVCPDIRMPKGASPLHPVTGVNWFDAQRYLGWLSEQMGMQVRLPDYTEWLEFAAEDAPIPKEKLFTDPRMAWAADYDITAPPSDDRTKAVGNFGRNTNGIQDLKGNVWEWTATSCGVADGRAVTSVCQGGGRVVMGEHLAVLSDLVRDPGNASCGGGLPPGNLGFRVVY
ncbi:SUMF1/EgtB/PvdO family nonheme iron enzyme [uncultured Tateyamaria sp.]|uniref:formylglycine-generating enzyme family protein n=1 Tax=uncultured Tateyamaria sp. TaxID=455651 RepID=UPI00261D7719|nr:SUMF1/EgtB/PvdO family nonheme iron enzyme [uncultured Tateyamaria sp.]